MKTEKSLNLRESLEKNLFLPFSGSIRLDFILIVLCVGVFAAIDASWHMFANFTPEYANLASGGMRIALFATFALEIVKYFLRLIVADVSDKS